MVSINVFPPCQILENYIAPCLFPSMSKIPLTPLNLGGEEKGGKGDLDLFYLDHCIHPPLSLTQRVLKDRYDGVWMDT